MIKRIVPYTEEWELAVAQLAHIAIPTIVPCGNCGYPIIRYYSCIFCKVHDPTDDQRKEFQEWMEKNQK